MSYDLQVWSVRAFDPSALEGADWLHPVDAQWIFEGKPWQISVSRSNRVLAEDIPEEVAGTLPGIHYLTDLSLEGKATAEAMRMAQSTANKIEKALHGTVFDPQEDTT